MDNTQAILARKQQKPILEEVPQVLPDLYTPSITMRMLAPCDSPPGVALAIHQQSAINTFVRNSNMKNERTTPRKRVLKAGVIEFTGSGGRIPCTLRNISDTGAAVELDGLIPIPREFVLIVEAVARPCHIVWRKEKRIGVTFD